MLDTPQRLDAASARSRRRRESQYGNTFTSFRALRYRYACESRRTTRLAADTSFSSRASASPTSSAMMLPDLDAEALSTVPA
jgi:hypothetical protein